MGDDVVSDAVERRVIYTGACRHCGRELIVIREDNSFDLAGKAGVTMDTGINANGVMSGVMRLMPIAGTEYDLSFRCRLVRLWRFATLRGGSDHGVA